MLVLTHRSLVYAVQTPWANTAWVAGWEIPLWEILLVERGASGLTVHVPPGRVESVVASDEELRPVELFMRQHVPMLYVMEGDAPFVTDRVFMSEETAIKPKSSGCLPGWACSFRLPG